MRKMRRREPVTAAPLSVSQLTCMVLLGIDPRRYLEFLIEHEVAHTRVGKLRVAMLDDVRAALRKLAIEADSEEPATAPMDDQPETADAVLAKLGLRRAS